MFKNFKEKHGGFFESKQSNASESDRGQDLSSILDRSQRADLTVLVAEVAESMRVRILELYEHTNPKDNSPNRSSPRPSPEAERDQDHKARRLLEKTEARGMALMASR